MTKPDTTAQKKQDEIFRKMSADKKIKLASALSMFCLKLNTLNARNNQSSKTSRPDSPNS